MAVNPIKTPFTKMSFTPDVPSSALSANEYNAGYNIETDVRSVKSVLGENFILSQIPGNIIFVTGGFLQGDTWYFLVATEQGKWYKIDDAGYANITPPPDLGVIISATTYGNLQGNSSSVAAGTYSNIFALSTTSNLGSLSSTTFDVTIFSGNSSYNGNAIVTVGNIGGTGWNFGDQITISGNVLGGTHPTNDLTFNITSGTLNNYGGSMTANTTYLNLTGSSSANSAHTFSNVSANTSGGGSGATFNVTLSANSVGYNSGNSITGSTTFGNISGTSSSAANGFYTNVSPISTSGIGSSAVFNVHILTNSTNYVTSAVISLVSGGVEYNNGDTVTISGINLGGTHPANDLIFSLNGNIVNYGGSFGANTVLGSITGNSGSSSIGTYNNVTQIATSGHGSGAIFDFRIQNNSTAYATTALPTVVYGGYGYNVGDTVTIAGNVLGGTNPTNNLTFTVANSVVNYGGSISNATTYAFVTGTSSSASNGNYRSVVPYLTSGYGSGAAFNVTLSANNASYTSNVSITVASGGNGYSIGDSITIPGGSLNGTTGVNDLTFVLANVVSAPTTTITFNQPGYGYNVNDTITVSGANLGGVAGTNDLSFVIGNTVANLGGTIGSSTTLGNISGKSSTTSSDLYTPIGQLSTSGTGAGATFSVRILTNNATYANSAIISLLSGGNGYKVGDTITISGANLGGTHPANDLVFTLGTAIGNYGGNFTGYNSSTVITASWNGEVVFLNDQLNPPMFYDIGYSTLALYDNPLPAPDSKQTYIWNYDVTVPSSGPQSGNIIPLYDSLTAGFVRVYNSTNVGSLLIAGNLTGIVAANVTSATPGTVQNLPTTIRWSQNFGLNAGPQTWQPTALNIANEVEIPVRGPVVDGFTLNGNFYLCSYWDTVLMAPIGYTSTTAPVFGITIVTQGRGLINENCWAIVDSTAYGLDARDIWTFNGSTFTPIGDQRIKNYFYSNLNPLYTNQIFMAHNSKKYQIEIYYPDLNSTGFCNQMISYRYDLDCWNPPRQVNLATMATESPVWTANIANLASRTIVYSSAAGNVQLVQKDIGTSFTSGNVANVAIASQFERDNISFGQDYSASIQVHRVYPEIYGTGNINITVGGADAVGDTPTYNSTQVMPIVTNNPWVQISQNEARITSIKVGATSNANVWQMTAANWQITKVQDTR